MAYFPFMVDIKDKKCLVVGGGSIALHKVRILRGFEPSIDVVAENVCDGLRECGEADSGITIMLRQFQDSDIEDADMVVAATDNEELNFHISDLCRAKRIPVNAVDMKEACSFIFPAMLTEKDLLVAISTGGQSPAAAAYVKQQLQQKLPGYYGDMIETLGNYRNMILEQIDTADKRKQVFNSLLKYGDSHGGHIPESVVLEEIERQKN